MPLQLLKRSELDQCAPKYIHKVLRKTSCDTLHKS